MVFGWGEQTKESEVEQQQQQPQPPQPQQQEQAQYYDDEEGRNIEVYDNNGDYYDVPDDVSDDGSVEVDKKGRALHRDGTPYSTGGDQRNKTLENSLMVTVCVFLLIIVGLAIALSRATVDTGGARTVSNGAGIDGIQGETALVVPVEEDDALFAGAVPVEEEAQFAVVMTAAATFVPTSSSTSMYTDTASSSVCPVDDGSGTMNLNAIVVDVSCDAANSASAYITFCLSDEEQATGTSYWGWITAPEAFISDDWDRIDTGYNGRSSSLRMRSLPGGYYAIGIYSGMTDVELATQEWSMNCYHG